ncbi:MAG: inositol 2-dehydrogenase [Proteobacteria bacterium]|nr:inositol 2-dehydrogenase [Pseudomonadota bacterium]
MGEGLVKICQFGAGRIGKIHAANVALNPRAVLAHVVDVDEAAAGELAAKHGARASEPEAALGDGAVDAVLIASSTDTHAELVEAAARAGKAIFCEKPIDLDLRRVNEVLDVVEKAGVPFFVGFNRRFDPSFRALHEAVAGGRIGKVELVAITSRDPGLPPLDYIRVSGGLFRDMMIHDLDMARWLMGSEPVKVYAAASILVDKIVAEADDVDSAVVTLKSESGVLCQINNSRRAVYGYDQRIEVFGSAGMARAENVTPTTLEVMDKDGALTDKPLHFFLERYADAYRLELDHFLDCVIDGAAPLTGGEEGRRALELADAALESVKTGKPVKV